MRAQSLLLILAACGAPAATGEHDAAVAAVDAPPVLDAPPPDAAAAPTVLSQAGLYADFASRTIAPGLRPYTPVYPLWADGLVKRRWLDLPAGKKIDTSDMDHWSFPVGTRFWKEFATPGGTVLETRLIEKIGANEWRYGAFVWRDDGSDADWMTGGAPDVRGTDHNVPDVTECQRCHVGEPGRYLGFAALQLGDAAVAALAQEGLLSDPPAPGRSFALPWDAKTNAAMGVFYGNCGHCHNALGSAAGGTSMRLRLTSADLALPREQTGVWSTIVGVPTDNFRAGTLDRIAPGMPDQSAIIVRMSSRLSNVQMPPIATKHVDTDGVATVTAWIDSL